MKVKNWINNHPGALGTIAGIGLIAGASECKSLDLADLPSTTLPVSYNQCTSRALVHPSRMPSLIPDKSFHAICDGGREVLVICFEQVMNVTKTDRQCSIKEALERYDLAHKHNLIP